MAILLSVSLGLSSIIVGGAKITGSLGNSVQAFYAADTGIEQALYQIFKVPSCANIAGGDCGTDCTYSVVINPNVNCEETGTSIKASGVYNGTNRKIEAYY